MSGGTCGAYDCHVPITGLAHREDWRRSRLTPGLRARLAARARRPRAWLHALALACALAVLALALPAAHASAAPPHIDGVSDQDLGLWSGNYQDASTLFNTPFPDFFAQSWVGDPPSQLRYARFVTAPDAAAQGGACQQNLYNWFTYVTQTLHLIPVIAVWDVQEGGCADHGAPSTAAYTTDIEQLLAYLDGLGSAKVQYLEAWNEPNSSGVSAFQAAAYWTAANTVCATDGCTAIAGDLVDNDPDQGTQSFEPGCAAGLTYNRLLAPYEDAYVTALGAARPAIWGFHPYFAVNCEQSTSVTTFEAHLPNPAGQVWFTEVGAWECVRGQTPPRGVTQQNLDASYLVNTLMSAADAPAHVFWYELAPLVYTQSCAKYADSALYMGTQAPGFLYARPAAATVYGVGGSLAAVTEGASGLSSGQVTLHGTATPGGIYEASYFFRYGLTTAYGFQTPTVNLPPGLAPVAVSATVSALTAGVPYHYQLVVTDTANTQRDGGDAVMTPPSVSAAAMAAAGSAVSVSWSGVSEPASSDWIGLYRQGGSSAIGGLYLDSCTATSSGGVPGAAGSCTLALPAGAGALYELRLYASASSGLLATSGTIGVPTLAAAPAMVAAGGSATVSWGDLSAPAPSDWVGLYAQNGSQAGWFYLDSCGAASSGAVPAVSGSCPYALPDAGGAYVLRLYSSVASGLLASSGELDVPALSAGPSIVPAGGAVTVSWSGVTAATSTDWVGLYASGGVSALGGLYTDSCASTSSGSRAVSGSCTLTAPAAPGAYVLRLDAQPGSGLLASSAAITVPAAVVPPAPVVALPVNAAPQASPAAPVDASAPLISGSARAGGILACAPGSWSGAPTAFAYSWLRDGAALTGASVATHLVTAADAGHALACAVTAINAGGASAPAASAPVSVLALPPIARVLGVAVNRRARQVTVRFDVIGDATAVRCALVRAGPPRYASCRSPRTYAGVRPGRYALYVVARGPGGAQASPAVYRFTVAAPARR